MQIALIDDGINTSFFSDLVVSRDLSVSPRKVEVREADDVILTDHGTTCARIINKYTEGVDFLSLRLFHETTLITSTEQLITAIKWCIDKLVPIIHLSLGSSLLNDYYLLRPLVAQALSRNQIIVAACSNRNQISFPSAIGGVIAVTTDPALIEDQYRVEVSEQNHTAIWASSSHILREGANAATMTQMASSYAAPTITAHVHEYLKRYEPLSISVKEVFQHLSGRNYDPSFTKPDFIYQAQIWNRGKKELLTDHLFFEYIDGQNNHRETDWVFIPSSDDEVMSKPISQRNILVSGKNRQELTKSNSFIWSENDLLLFNDNDSKNLDDIECPLVRIIGSELEMIDYLCLLRDAFIREGYQCLGVSDLPLSYLYGLEYQENLSENLFTMDSMVQRYQPDVILFAIKRHIVEVKSSDLLRVFVVDEENKEVDFRKNEGGNELFIRGRGPKDIEELLRIILNKFA